MNNQKGFIHIILILIIAVAIVGAGGFFLVNQIAPNTVVNPNPTPTACTQEAKLCPDGSYVSRTGPNCDFAACPPAYPNPSPNPDSCSQLKCNPGQTAVEYCTTNLNPQCYCSCQNNTSGQCPPGTRQVGQTNSIPPSPICELEPSGYKGENKVTLTEGQKDGPLLVQKIYSDYITGLNFIQYPVASSEGKPITLYIGQTASNGCDTFLELARIEGKTAIFNRLYSKQPCPICLAENTLIDTPNGQIPVQNLEKGDIIWTVDEFGMRIADTIIKTSKTPVLLTHYMMHIILDDKREIFASPGHPIGDGRVFNDLLAGDILDGSKIATAEKTLHGKNYTYDILPSGSTGFYFANGILIGSTLK